MGKKTRVVVLVLGVALALGCGGLGEAIERAAASVQPTPPPVSKLDHVGTWVGEGVTLTVHGDGMLEYVQAGENTSSSFNAPIQRWEEGAIVAGIGPIEKTFQIQAPPRDEGGGTWTMVVDGRRLVRQ